MVRSLVSSNGLILRSALPPSPRISRRQLGTCPTTTLSRRRRKPLPEQSRVSCWGRGGAGGPHMSLPQPWFLETRIQTSGTVADAPQSSSLIESVQRKGLSLTDSPKRSPDSPTQEGSRPIAPPGTNDLFGEQRVSPSLARRANWTRCLRLPVLTKALRRAPSNPAGNQSSVTAFPHHLFYGLDVMSNLQRPLRVKTGLASKL